MARRTKILISKVYTRTGDTGETGLAGGDRVPKDGLRIEAIGAVDELNATVGLALQALEVAGNGQERIGPVLLRIQSELFDLGSELASPPDIFQAGMPAVSQTEVTRMERLMDTLNTDLQPLRGFVLPGGGPVSAALHLSRTVCRRAEREVLRLSRQEAVRPEALKYLNRLSDLLFVLLRWAAHQGGHEEVLWQPHTKRL